MKRTKIALLAGLCMLGACSSTQNGSHAALSVEPVMRITDASGTPRAQYRLGRYYQGQNRFELAMAAYRRALEMDANYSEAHNALGVLYSRQQKYPEAIAEFTAALNAAPGAAHVLNNLGYTYLLQGEYEKAVFSLRQALAIEAGNARAQNNLALAYTRLETTGKTTLAMSAEMGVPPVTKVKPDMVLNSGAETLDVAAEKIKVAHESQGVIIRQTPPLQVAVVQVTPPVYTLQRTAYQEASPAPAPVDQSLPKVEVSNGNGVEGLARRVGIFLRESGYPGTRLTNQKPFNVGVSQIQYRQGYEAAAQSLRQTMPGQPTLVLTESLRGDIQIRLLLGRDFSAQQAIFAKRGETPKTGPKKG